jgi:Ni/Fe-hydrogenase subunit HybB-like protein
MFLFIIAGVVLSCLHQSSLGNLMVIAPTKTSPLWFTPILSMLFLLSAIAVGFAMVIFESMIAARVFGRRLEMEVLAPLSRIIPVLLMVYLAFKAVDLMIRGAADRLLAGGLAPVMFVVEVGAGVVAPLVMLLLERVRRRPLALFTAAALVVLGVAVNRINVFLVAFTPLYATRRYVPSVGEIAVTVALISGLLLLYRFLVSVLPILPATEAPRQTGGDSRRVAVAAPAAIQRWSR